MREEIIRRLSVKVTEKTIWPIYGGQLNSLTDFMDLLDASYIEQLVSADPEQCSDIQKQRKALQELRNYMQATLEKVYEMVKAKKSEMELEKE